MIGEDWKQNSANQRSELQPILIWAIGNAQSPLVTLHCISVTLAWDCGCGQTGQAGRATRLGQAGHGQVCSVHL